MSDLDTTELRKAYWTHIRRLADEVREQMAERPDEDEYDIVHDMADQSEWVIYTGKAILALYLSDQDANLYIEEFGAVPTNGSDPCIICRRYERVDSLDFSALAFAVVRADIQEQLTATNEEAKAS